MSLVRCQYCGEVASPRFRTCMGCDRPLSEAPPARPPRRTPPAQLEAGADLSASKAILIGLLVGGAISLILMFLSGVRAVSLAVPFSIVVAILWVVLAKPKKDGEASAQGIYEQIESRRNSSFEKGLKVFLLIVGGLGALVMVGFMIFFIVCLASFDKLF